MKQRKPYKTYTKEFKQEDVRLMEAILACVNHGNSKPRPAFSLQILYKSLSPAAL